MRVRSQPQTTPINRPANTSRPASAEKAARSGAVDAFELAPPVPSSSRPTVSRGDSGASVSTLQRLLAQRGFDPGVVDGDFGSGTQAALVAFQRANGLEADGVCGPRSWAALEGSGFQTPQVNSGTVVVRGDSGASVSTLQRLLAQRGFDPGPVDGDFGAGTQAALVAFQRANGLDADGVCGPRSWAALGGSGFQTPQVNSVTEVDAGSGTLRSRILALAQAEVGTMERTGNNDGEVLKYPEFFGRGSEPYCADFVSWVNTQAGNPLDFAYVPYLRDHLEANGKWKGRSDPQPGDIVIFDFERGGEGDHVGIVKAVNADGTIETIEGNTSPDDRLSDSATLESGVWNRVRSLDDILGFGNP